MRQDMFNPQSNEVKAEEVVQPDGTTITVVPYGGKTELATDREPWDRQPGEPDRSWLYYKYFQDLPADGRTYQAGYRAAVISMGRLTPGNDRKQCPDWYRILANQWRWRERARSRDMYEQEVGDRALLAHRIQSRLQTAELGSLLRSKAAEAAALIQTVIIQKDSQGRAVLKSNLSVADIAKLAQVGAGLERAALGLDKPQGTAIAVQVQVGAQEPMSDAQIVGRAEEVLRRRQKLIDVEARTKRG
jgi:hypothetical protein